MRHFILFLFLPIVIAGRANPIATGDTLVLHKEKYPNGKLSAYSWILQSTGNGHAACTSRGQHQFVRLKPKQTSVVLNEIQAQFFSDPAKTASIHITALNKARKAKGKTWKLIFKSEFEKSTSEKSFQYVIVAI